MTQQSLQSMRSHNPTLRDSYMKQSKLKRAPRDVSQDNSENLDHSEERNNVYTTTTASQVTSATKQRSRANRGEAQNKYKVDNVIHERKSPMHQRASPRYT